MEGKVAIITGSSMGIGKALAEEMAKKGVKIMLNGRDEARLLVTQKYMLEKGYEVAAEKADVSNHHDCQKLIENTVARFGRIDFLINNAGLAAEGKIEDLSPEVFRKVMDVNFLGSVYPTQAALPYLKQNSGSVLFISSLAAIHGLPNFSIYSASKMTLTGLAEALKIELKGTGVHVGVAYIGFTQNDPEKTFYNAEGSLAYMPKRDGVKVEPVDKVAKRLVRMLENRTHKSTFSVLGKLLAALKRLSPVVVEKVLTYSFEKREKEKKYSKIA